MRIIFKTLFGSHLYGLNTPKSDKDYKAIGIPDAEDILLQRAFKSKHENTKPSGQLKNTAEDTDTEIYSLHQFIKLCDEGQTVALDMLFSTRDKWVTTSAEWEFIIDHRARLIHKDATSFVGYCQTQAAKYGIKGSRINAVKKVISTIEDLSNPDLRESSKLSGFFNGLVEILEHEEHISFIEMESPGLLGKTKKIRGIEVSGKKLQESITVQYALDVLNTINNNYGERARLAAANEGIDWKAVSHALRVCFEAQELLRCSTVTFPLEQREFLLEVKAGRIPYVQVAERLERELAIVKELEAKSLLPDSIDKDFWERFIIDTYREEINNE